MSHTETSNNNNLLETPNKQSMSSIASSLLAIKEDTFDCPLCQSLLYNPITTSCGHTFCRECILRVMDHDNKCPLCRSIIHITPDHGVSLILQEIIQQVFPEQYQQRRAEKESEIREQTFNLPLFLLGQLVLFPKAALPLHVFEPRYRLMVRRCLEGGRRFGVVPYINGNLSPIGTTAAIENHYLFPDGRSLISTNGEKRFKVLDTWDQDGYKVARVEYIDDLPMTEEESRSVQDKYMKAKELVRSKLSDALPQIEEKVGKMPENNPSDFSWWLASVVPANTTEKYQILETCKVSQRFDRLIQMLSNAETTSNCNIQ